MKAVFLLQTDLFVPRPVLRALREADALRAVGWDCSFVCWIKDPAALSPSKSEPYPVQRVTFPIPPLGSSFLRRAMAYREVTKELSRVAAADAPDLLVSHDLEVLAAAVRAGRARRAPVIYDSHEDWPALIAANSRLEARVAAIQERRLCRRVAHIVSVSEPIAERFRRMNRPASVLYNARPSSEVLLADRDASREAFGYGIRDFVAGFSGALAPGRGLDILLDALGRLDDTFKALIIGGPLEEVERLRTRARSMSLAHRVRVEGHRPFSELPPYYASMDVGVMLLEPRAAESLGVRVLRTAASLNLQIAGNLSNKLFDYLAYGIPMIVPDYPAMAALARDTGAGVVLPDLTPSAVAASLADLQAHPARRAEMATRGRESFLERYAWEKQAETFLRIVQGLERRTRA